MVTVTSADGNKTKQAPIIASSCEIFFCSLKKNYADFALCRNKCVYRVCPTTQRIFDLLGNHIVLFCFSVLVISELGNKHDYSPKLETNVENPGL